MWGRDKNFQVSMLYELINRKNQIYGRDLFAFPHFNIGLGDVHPIIVKWSVT